MSLASSSPQTLVPFTSPQPGSPVRLLETNVVRAGDGVLHFQYKLDADLSRVRVPARGVSRQVDELWKHTCFEAFIALAERGPERGYRELNFSPSTEWAAYSFTGYRQGMAPIHMPTPPEVRVEVTATSLQLNVSVDTRPLFESGGRFQIAPFQIALAAVIEDTDGTLTYWALQHASARPDFHHPAGFILEV